MSFTPTLAFGPLLKHLRKQAGMTQRDLAAALGYSESFICNLEKAQRQPDLKAVTEQFVAALGLQDDPQTAATLIEQAALARGERPPTSVTFQRTTQVSVQEECTTEHPPLPSPPTELIGRAAEVNQLCNRLLGHRGRLLTLVGPPGIGKTTLALAVATHLQDHYRDGAAFVPLAAVSDAVLMASTIAAAVGSSDASPKLPQTKLIGYLRRKTMLLVLDNLEQITNAASLIADLLAECPGLCVVATSRERLHLRAEQRFQVLPLDLAPAIELFVQRAQAVNADFCLTLQNQPTLAAICQRLDCLPLALELCAAQIDLLAPAQLLAQLQDHRLDLLVEGAHDLPPRQRTLRTAIQHSYRLLDEEERTLLRRLGVFVDGFDLPAIAAVVADRAGTAAHPLHIVSQKSLVPHPPVQGPGAGTLGVPDKTFLEIYTTLHALIGKSLVRAATLPSGEQRFLLLETIREFALEQLQAHGEKALLHQCHYVAYLQRFRMADSHSRGDEAVTWVVSVEPDQDNLRAALRWTLDAARYTDAAWLMVAAHYLWFLRGSRYEGAQWLAQLLPHRQTLAPELRLATFIAYYATAFEVEGFPPLERYTAEIMELLEGCTNKLLQAAACYWLAMTTPDVAQATTRLARCIALARAGDEALPVGNAFSTMGDRQAILASALKEYAFHRIDQGALAQAVPIVTESLALFQARGNHYGIGECLGLFGRLALLQGDLTQAQRFFAEVVTLATTFNLRMTQCSWQPLLGIVTLYAGDTAAARRLLNESLHLCLALKNQFFLARVCLYLADLALWEKELDESAHWLAQSLGYRADPRWIAVYRVEHLWVAARLATAKQQLPQAAALFGLAEQRHRQIDDAIGGPMRSLADAALLTVRAALEPALFAEAFAAGQQMTLEEAFITILAPAHLLPYG